MQICQVEISAGIKNGITKKVRAWPANSSATTSRGSAFPVATIATGANRMQITEPAKTKIAIAIDISTGVTPKWQIAAKIIVGGSEAHVPGARGSRPRPKHDTSILFIVTEG